MTASGRNAQPETLRKVSAPRQPSRRTAAAVLLAIVAMGLLLRVRAAVVFPVTFDEVQVVAYGVARGMSADDPREILLRIPLAVSNGITPLWLWLQALPCGLLGETSRLGLRVVPVLLGATACLLAFLVSAELFTHRVGLVAALLVAVASPMVFTNARGEFAESLLVVLALQLLRDLAPNASGRAIPTRAMLWPALALFTYLGKGLLLYGAYALYLTALFVLGLLRPAFAGRLAVRRLGLLLAGPLVLPGAFLIAAQSVAFTGVPSLMTDVGPVGSVWEAIHRLTLGYGSTVKADMVGSPLDALYVYRDFGVWPTTTLLALPSLVALSWAVAGVARGFSRGDPVRLERSLLLLALALPGAAIVVGRGVLDARFHLVSQAILTPYLAHALDRWVDWAETGRRFLFGAAGAGALLPAWLGILTHGSQAGDTAATRSLALLEVTLVALVCVTVLMGRLPRQARGRAALAILSALLVIPGLLVGPLDWGRRWAWEPGPPPAPAPRSVTEFASVELQLARRFVERDGLLRAAPFLARALEAHPEDRDTLLEAGELLLEGDPREAERVIVAVGGYLRGRPDDPALRALLRRALELARRSSP